MIITISSSGFTASPVTLGPKFPLYRWRLKSANCGATGTSTLVSSVTISLVRGSSSLVLLNAVTTSTVLTVDQVLDFFSPGSGLTTQEYGYLTGEGIHIPDSGGPGGYINVAWVNNGSYYWELTFEEVP